MGHTYQPIRFLFNDSVNVEFNISLLNEMWKCVYVDVDMCKVYLIGI